MANVKFKISSALKTIIGKELITDDFIAVFELVKNSFDAQAKRVDITFGHIKSKTNKIIIQDNGNGMNEEDIVNKWLFVAYSDKKKQRDYRDKINSVRIFAGAKGIGRFACDRLGEKLKIYTKKKDEKDWNVLSVDWNRFEDNPEKEFQNIPADYTTQSDIPYQARYGTILEINNLRSNDWNREKLLKLRRSLERLVNPNQGNDAENFQIYLHSDVNKAEDVLIKDEAKKKKEEVGEWQLVNGPVKNFVFENLGLKTAQIFVEIDSKGNTLHTRLIDRGLLVYDLKEENPYSKALHDVSIHLFALNQGAKHAFTRRMGVRIHEYGSVFLYKNGFRIHPFGDPTDDQLGIDKRHQQGFFRTLGTRDISGRIEINGSNEEFQETSSRDGGLIQNHALSDLKNLFIEIALKRLETFAIDLAKFGTQKGELPNAEEMSKAEVKQAIFEIIAKLTKPKQVISIVYDPNFLNILENKSTESVSALLGNLKRLAAQQNSSALSKEVSKAEKQLKILAKAKEEAEIGEARERERAKKAEEEARNAQEKIEQAEEKARRATVVAQEAKYREQKLDTQNVFLKAALSKDLEHVLTLHHSIGQDVLTIEQYVSNLILLTKNGATLPPEQLRVSLERISFVAKKISAISRFITRANHAAAQEELTSDLVEYIREYLINIYEGMVLDPYRNPIPIRVHESFKASFITTFTPLKICIILDNLINNSRKHKVKNIDVNILECSTKKLVISFVDDGVGIPKRNIPNLFEVGFSTTDGSGLGLHHTREIMTEMQGTIEFVSERKIGAEFKLVFPKI